jgi:hypothetical protein
MADPDEPGPAAPVQTSLGRHDSLFEANGIRGKARAVTTLDLLQNSTLGIILMCLSVFIRLAVTLLLLRLLPLIVLLVERCPIALAGIAPVGESRMSRAARNVEGLAMRRPGW